MRTSNERKQYLSKKTVASRYETTERTIDRWERDPRLGFPKSFVIHRRRFWQEAELDDWDAERVRASIVKPAVAGDSGSSPAPTAARRGRKAASPNADAPAA